jgi:hypothetical protein
MPRYFHWWHSATRRGCGWSSVPAAASVVEDRRKRHADADADVKTPVAPRPRKVAPCFDVMMLWMNFFDLFPYELTVLVFNSSMKMRSS